MRKLWIPLALAAVILVVGAFLAVRSLPTRNGQKGGAEVSRAGDTSPTDPDLLAGGTSTAAQAEVARRVGDEPGAETILPGEPVLHGKVTDEEGRPIEGAFIHLQTGGAAMFRGGRGGMNLNFIRERLLGKSSPDTRSHEGYRTGTDGSYAIRIASIPNGSYEVLAVHSEHAPMSENWTWVEESTEINFRLPPGDSITGIVYDPDGKPVGGAVVMAMLDEDGGGFGRGFRGARNFSSKTISNEDGTFRLGVAPGTFLVEANAKGFAEGDVRAVPSGMEDVEVVLEPAQGIAGRVVDASGAPIAGAHVRVHRGFGGEGFGGRRGGFGGGRGGPGGGGGAMRAGMLLLPPEAQVETDAEGAFLASDLSPGEYFVSAEKAGFVPQRSDAKLEVESPPEPLLITLEAGKVLSGTVKDPRGNAVANAFVAVAVDEGRGRDRGGRGGPGGGPPGFRRGGPQGSEGGETKDGEAAAAAAAAAEPRRPEPHSPFEAAAVAESDASGAFKFDTLSAGKYSVSVQSNEFTVYRQDAIELETPVDLEIVLDPGIALEGAVVSSADGKPVPGARVTFEVDNGDRREIRADSEGSYKLGGLFPGKLEQVVVDAKGFSVSMLMDVPVEKSPAVQKVDFQVDAAAVLSGIVLDAEGAPVFNARVTVMPDVEEEGEGGDDREQWRARRWQMTQIASGKTGPDGRFTMGDVNSNPAVRISVQHQDFKPFRSDPLAVRPAEKREDLRYTLRSGGRIDVLVRDSGGVPFPGARVRVASKPVPVPESAEPAAEELGGRGGFRGQGGTGGPGGRGGRGGRGDRSWTRTSGPDGKAYFKGLDGGEYDITASVRNFRPYAASLVVAEEQTVPFVLDLGPESWIAGRVTDAAGMPLANVSLEALREQGNGFERQETRSAEDGAFRIGSLGDGPYTVRARLQGFSEGRLEGVEVDRNTDIVLQQLGGIAGNVVVAETGAPVVSFAIRVRPEGERRRGAEAGGRGGGEAGRGRFGGGFGGPGGGPGGGFGGRDRERRNFNDPSGAFLIENVTPGSYVLEVTAEGYAGVEVPVRVDEGRVTEGILATLVEGLALSGLVQAKAGAIPLQGAQVFLLAMQQKPVGSEEERPQGTLEERRRARDEAAQTRREARREGGASNASAESQLAAAAFRAASRGGNLVQTTDATGAFQLVDVTPGEYTLVVNHEAFIPARVPITVASDGVARFIRIDLEKGEELEGTITLADGSAGTGATVFLRSADGLTKRVMADPSGRYHMQGLIEGAYSFSTRAGGGGRRMAPIELTISKGTNRFDFRVEETASR